MTPAQQYLTHVTRGTERWDLIAWRYYGDPTNFNPIIMANPAVPIVPVLDAGIVLAIPVLAASETATTGLPPWATASTTQTQSQAAS